MTIRCAVVGTGFIGLDHLRAYEKWSEDAEIVAIAEPIHDRAEKVAQEFGARAYTDYRDLFRNEKVRAVSICTPTGLHLPVVKAAAKAGVDILLEKPMARTVSECDKIIRVCRAAGVKLMISFTSRFFPELRMAKQMIDEGKLGDVRLALDFFSFGEHKPWPGWYYNYELSGGGEMIHDAVHSIDRLAWLIGSPIVEVYGRTTSNARGIENVEDGGVACLTFANGAVASLFINQATYPLVSSSQVEAMPGRAELELHGTQGSLVYSLWGALRFSSPFASFTFQSESCDEMGAEVREFLDALLEDREPSVGGEQGRQAIAVVQANYESERRNAPVRVEEMLEPS